MLRQLIFLAAEGVQADRATLYLLDEERQELRSLILMEENLHEIRLPIQEGVAGYVARTGETVNLTDAYADPRFSPRIDRQIGYRTRTLLTVPLRDPQGKICGVLQAINKEKGPFQEQDLLYLQALAGQSSLALESARLHSAMVADCRRLKFLYRIGSLLSGEYTRGIESILREVLKEAAEALDAESGSILLPDPARERLVFLTISGEEEPALLQVEVPIEQSIAGWILQNEQAVIINEVQSDPRFFAGVDERTGRVTRTMIGTPLQIRGRTIGVLEVLNKREGRPFTRSDLDLAQAIANHTALALESAQHYETLRRLEEQQERWETSDFPDLLTLLRG